MDFLKTRANICFLSVILLAVAALIITCSVIHEKNREIKKLNNQITSANTELEEARDKVEEEKDKNSSANSSLKSELKKAKEEMEKLEKERDSLKKKNSSLQKENATLTAKKNSSGKTSSASKTTSSKNNSVSSKGPKTCYLTFDDGPSDNTLKILNILDKYNAKATFFVINTKKVSYVKKIHEKGHTIGLHTYTHDYSKLYASEKAYFSDLQKISDKVESLTGIKSKIIRFPGGSSNQISNNYCNGIMKKLVKSVPKKGYYYFDWNVDSMDASGSNVSYTKIKNSVLASSANKNSICVLMHDTDAKNSTVTALPKIIEGLKKQGFTQFKGLSEDSPGYRHSVS